MVLVQGFWKVTRGYPGLCGGGAACRGRLRQPGSQSSTTDGLCDCSGLCSPHMCFQEVSRAFSNCSGLAQGSLEGGATPAWGTQPSPSHSAPQIWPHCGGRSSGHCRLPSLLCLGLSPSSQGDRFAPAPLTWHSEPSEDEGTGPSLFSFLLRLFRDGAGLWLLVSGNGNAMASGN